MMNRRALLTAGVALGAFAAMSKSDLKGALAGTMTITTDTTIDFKHLSDAEWHKRLDEAQYYVLRKHGTERAGTSPLNHEKRKGTFECAGCDLALFSSDTKFESGTGWPSFISRCRARSAHHDRPFVLYDAGPRCIAAAASAISAMCSTTAATDGLALLHERRVHEIRAGGGLVQHKREPRQNLPVEGRKDRIGGPLAGRRFRYNQLKSLYF